MNASKTAITLIPVREERGGVCVHTDLKSLPLIILKSLDIINALYTCITPVPFSIAIVRATLFHYSKASLAGMA